MTLSQKTTQFNIFKLTSIENFREISAKNCRPLQYGEVRRTITIKSVLRCQVRTPRLHKKVAIWLQRNWIKIPKHQHLWLAQTHPAHIPHQWRGLDTAGSAAQHRRNSQGLELNQTFQCHKLLYGTHGQIGLACDLVLRRYRSSGAHPNWSRPRGWVTASEYVWIELEEFSGTFSCVRGVMKFVKTGFFEYSIQSSSVQNLNLADEKGLCLLWSVYSSLGAQGLSVRQWLQIWELSKFLKQNNCSWCLGSKQNWGHFWCTQIANLLLINISLMS